jgi:Tol biopolymer transport system component
MLAARGAPAGIPLTPPNIRVVQPAWSRDGHRIAFVEGGPGNGESVVVATVKIGGASASLTHERVLATGKVAQPSFTADGKWVSYLRPSGDGFKLYARRIVGGPEIQIKNVPSDIDARWTPIWTR